MMRWDIINHFIKKNGYKSYLEIGYYKGWSFDRIDALFKTAVDPNPSKTPEQESWINGHHNIGKAAKAEEVNGKVVIGEATASQDIFKMTSDEFFANITPSTKWDIIFVDGLHESRQAFKDVVNAIKHLSDNGIIIMHDCNPPTERHTTSGVDGCWTGDVYKAAIYVKEFGPFYTIDIDWGVGVLYPINRAPLIGSIYDLEPSGRWWDNFAANRKQLINLISLEEFKQIEKIDG